MKIKHIAQIESKPMMKLTAIESTVNCYIKLYQAFLATVNMH